MNNSIFTSLIDMLVEKAEQYRDKRVFHFMPDTSLHAYESMSYIELLRHAHTIAIELQRHAKNNDRALLIYPPGLDYIKAFWGCLIAGVIPIPAYPPFNKDTISKLESIMTNASPAVIMSNDEVIKNIRRLSSLGFIANNPLLRIVIDNIFKDFSQICRWNYRNFSWLSTSGLGGTDEFTPVKRKSDDIAYLQYTSGSMSDPRGTIIRHSNILDNLRLIDEFVQASENDNTVCWLPPYHDMGLISSVLMPVYKGASAYLMSPVTFIRSPLVWLQAITKMKSGYSGGPNFAYALCNKKILTENDQSLDLDLSCWKVAFNGSEPVNAEILEEFSRKFAPYGFDPTAFKPCYGLAEATLLVSGVPKQEHYRVKSLDSDAFNEHKVISHPGNSGSRQIVSCGKLYQHVSIIDTATNEMLPFNSIGEIWVKGPSVATGYWNNDECSDKTFIQPRENGPVCVRTGDLGFIDENNELYITGRMKDLIIINGKNYYPQDIEHYVSGCDSQIRPGCVIAFSYENRETEALAIVCEVKNPGDYEHIRQAIIGGVTETFGISPELVAFISHKTMLKTTSGKLRRQETRKLILTDKLPTLYLWRKAASRNDDDEKDRRRD